MTSSNRNKGKNSGDDRLFGKKQHPFLKQAVDDQCYLLSRGYSSASAIEIGKVNGYNWNAELLNDPDQKLAESKNVVISSDGWILDRAEKWFNLAGYLIINYIKTASILEV